MTGISDLLDRRCVRLSLQARNKRSAIREMVELLSGTEKITNPQEVERGLWEREKLITTAIGHGVAIPHYLGTDIAGPVMAVGRKVEGINFHALDGDPVTLIFMLVGPQGRESEHLKVLSRLSRYLGEAGFRQDLLDARAEENIVDLFRRREMDED